MKISLSFLLTPAVVVCHRTGYTGRENCLYCHLQEVEKLFRNTTRSHAFECVVDSSGTTDGKSFKVDLQPEFSSHFKREMREGTMVCVPHGTLNVTTGRVQAPDGVHFVDEQIESSRRRYLAPSTGQSSALAVRVISSANNESPNASVEDLKGRLFGIGPQKESVNLVSQYELCSKAEFRIRPAVVGTDVTDGVLEIDVDFQLRGKDIDVIRQDLVDAVESQTGQSIASYEHVLFCVPPGTFNDGDDDWAAFAILGGRITFYNDIFCDTISLVIHEVGHNLRFRHSNEDGEYEDKSCYMGISYSSFGAPAMCFNGQKMFQSGWYTETSRIVDPATNGPWFGRLVAFVDHNLWLDSNGAHVIKVDHYFLVYNRAKLHNRGTQEKRDLVTVVEEIDELSEMIGGIPEGGSICTSTLCFEVCEYTVEEDIDFAWVCIRTTSQPSCCESALPSEEPSDAPTPLPSTAPTAPPSPLPSISATSTGPTSFPTEAPTDLTLTGAPSSDTNEPTMSLPTPVSLSTQPTKASSKSPTSVPTRAEERSPMPTEFPTEEKLSKKGIYPGVYDEHNPGRQRRLRPIET